jgi:Spy/CpxP family protein refolding chaperone
MQYQVSPASLVRADQSPGRIDPSTTVVSTVSAAAAAASNTSRNGHLMMESKSDGNEITHELETAMQQVSTTQEGYARWG